MSARTRQPKGRSNQKGSVLVEFGPALLILLLIFFFPLVNLINIGTIYIVSFTLNDLQVQAASQRTQAEGQDPQGFVQKALPDTWSETGLGHFVKLASKPETTVTYSDLLPGSADKVVAVTTKIVAGPFLDQPYIPHVAGLSAPMHFQFHSERVMERSAETASVANSQSSTNQSPQPTSASQPAS
jgi:hypothetical protein